MGRRRDDDDDEDEEELDESPRKRRSSKRNEKKSNTPMILPIVIVVAVAVVILGCGGMVWWAVSSTNKAITEIAGQIEASDEADNFLGKLSSEQSQAAYDSTTPAFKTAMTKDQFAALVKKHPLLSTHEDIRPLTTNAPTGKTPNRKKVTTYELTEGDDSDPDFEQPQPKKGAKGGPKSLRVTITVAEQAGGFWKVDSLAVEK